MQEKFYLIFWDQKPESVTPGLRGQPSPDHVSMVWLLDQTAIHLDPQYSHVDKTIYMPAFCLPSIEPTFVQLTRDNPLKTLHSIFHIEICKPPKLDLKLYSRPIYCFNYVIHTIGMQLGQVFTTFDLHEKVTSYSGKTNFISRKVYSST
jgi:hypothetical protein